MHLPGQAGADALLHNASLLAVVEDPRQLGAAMRLTVERIIKNCVASSPRLARLGCLVSD